MTILAGAPIVISTVAERSGEISRLHGQESGCGFRRRLCRRVVKEKVDGPPSRGFLRFLSLTRLRHEGCCGGFAADLKKGGCGWRRRLYRRVASLRSGGDSACGAEGCGIALTGDEYKVSVTDLPFCVIWHDEHSAGWLAALASPYPASPDFPLFRGQNKTPRGLSS